MLEDDTTYQKLVRIESELFFLSAADQKLAMWYKLTLETGGKLPAGAPTHIDCMFQTLSTEVDMLEAPLSIARMLRDLETADKMLSPSERAFCKEIKSELLVRALSTPEVERLLGLYGDKGF